MKARTPPPPFCFISLLTRGISLVSFVFNLSTCFFPRYRNKMKQKGESCRQNGYYLGLNRILRITDAEKLLL